MSMEFTPMNKVDAFNRISDEYLLAQSSLDKEYLDKLFGLDQSPREPMRVGELVAARDSLIGYLLGTRRVSIAHGASGEALETPIDNLNG